MLGKEIDLQQMLMRREARAREQDIMLSGHDGTIISFTMNIPGPIKTNEYIRKAFDTGKAILLQKLQGIGAEISSKSELHEDTGDELMLCVANIPPDTLKDIAIAIESSSRIGRLYDIDVIDAHGHKLSRKTFRKCLICDRQAQECARSRTHTVSEMQEAVMKLLC